MNQTDVSISWENEGFMSTKGASCKLCHISIRMCETHDDQLKLTGQREGRKNEQTEKESVSE